MMWAIIIFVLSVIITGFFAGYETGFVSANLIRIRNMAEKGRRTEAMRLAAHYENPARLITMLLIGTNLSLVIGTSSLTRAIGPGIATLIATPTFLIFAEIVPKSIFRHFPTRLVVFFFPLIRFLEGGLAVFTIPIAWTSQRFLSLLDDEGKGMSMFLTSIEDMRVLVDESHDQGTLDPDEHEMIHSVIDLQTQCANRVMVPRIHIQALPSTATTQELKALFIESGRTRLPIYEENIDRIVGTVNVFDVIKDADPAQGDISRYIKPVLHVPDSMKLDDVLKALRDARQSMAIVTDEYGGTDGLITVEDILEEIFGEIHDEYDVMTTQIQKVGPRAYVVNADTALEDLARVTGVDIEDEDVETVGGWVSHLAGHIPAKGEVVHHENFRITVLDGQPSHVASIRLEIIEKPTSENEDASTSKSNPQNTSENTHGPV